MKNALHDVLVLELASVLAGPSVGMFLAELGARVIKIEHFSSGGDVTRSWKLASEDSTEDRSAYFSCVNWGKQSVGIDLRTAAGKALVHQLSKKADIVIASYKPGDAVKLQMDAETLMSLNPSLIYADISAYGGEDARSGFDAIIQAEAGFTYMNGVADGGPTKMPVALMDLLAAHQLKEGILLALLERMKTGNGKHVSTTLLGAGLASLANQAANWLVGGVVPQRIGSEHPNIVPYGSSYPTADGKEVVLAVGNDVQFGRLCECLGLSAISNDPAYAHNADRVRNRHALNGLLARAIVTHARDTLLVMLQQAHVPVGAVHDMREACAQPQADALMLLGKTMKGLRSIALSGMEGVQLSEPPHLAANTVSILTEFLACSDQEMTNLRFQKVIL